MRIQIGRYFCQVSCWRIDDGPYQASANASLFSDGSHWAPGNSESASPEKAALRAIEYAIKSHQKTYGAPT